MRRSNKKDLGSSPEVIRGAALRMLTRRPYAKAELLRRLKEKGAQEGAAKEVLKNLAERGFLDDAMAAESLIRRRKSANIKGRQYILRELAQKGIESEVAEHALEEHYPPEEERAALRRQIQRSLQGLAVEQPKRKRQLDNIVRRMGAKGFPIGAVFEILQEEALESLDNME